MNRKTNLVIQKHNKIFQNSFWANSCHSTATSVFLYPEVWGDFNQLFVTHWLLYLGQWFCQQLLHCKTSHLLGSTQGKTILKKVRMTLWYLRAVKCNGKEPSSFPGKANDLTAWLPTSLHREIYSCKSCLHPVLCGIANPCISYNSCYSEFMKYVFFIFLCTLLSFFFPP